MALHVQSKIYTAYVLESHHAETVDALFSELSHICPEADTMQKDLKTIRKETLRSVLAIATQVKAAQQGARLQERVDVSAAVEERVPSNSPNFGVSDRYHVSFRLARGVLRSPDLPAKMISIFLASFSGF